MENKLGISVIIFSLVGILHYESIHSMSRDTIEFKIPIAGSHVVFTCDKNQQEPLTKKTYEDLMRNSNGIFLGVTLSWLDQRIVCKAYDGHSITRWAYQDPAHRKNIINILYYFSIHAADPLFLIGSFNELDESLFLRAAFSATSGDAKGMCVLGCLYEDGIEGAPQDYLKARVWYERAIENKNEDALSCLGYLYQEGLGVEQNNIKAKELYQRAFESTNQEVRDDAQKSLALIDRE